MLNCDFANVRMFSLDKSFVSLFAIAPSKLDDWMIDCFIIMRQLLHKFLLNFDLKLYTFFRLLIFRLSLFRDKTIYLKMIKNYQ